MKRQRMTAQILLADDLQRPNKDRIVDIMKVETKNLNPGSMPDARIENRVSLCTFRFILFYVFCLVFLPLCFLTSLGGAEISAEQLDPNGHLQRQLWQARISAAQSEKNEVSKNELKRMIERIRSVKFKPRKQPPEPVIVVEPAPTTEPNETAPDTAVRKEHEKKEIEPKLPYEPITDQTLQMLKSLSLHPDKLDNPFELGEILFLSGNLKEATVFYREALNRKGLDDVGSAQDRPWVLLQIGNRLRNDDLAVAATMYKQLITEYPNSLWVDLAKAQDELISWYQKDTPRKLIAECK